MTRLLIPAFTEEKLLYPPLRHRKIEAVRIATSTAS
jgi:hypothetical protein